MPLLGFLLASSFASYIQKFDHWIACVLLVLIGANMLREAFSKEEEQGNDSFSFRVMLPLAIATSIDALATGVTFAMMGVNIWIAIAITGLTTFVFSVAGVKIGNLFGSRYQSKAELVGGLILIAMGIKILVEHLHGRPEGTVMELWDIYDRQRRTTGRFHVRGTPMGRGNII